MTLTDYITTDFAAAKDNHERSTIVRYWRRAALETLYDRSITSIAIQAPRKPHYISRYLPYWLAVDDGELQELHETIMSGYLSHLD